MRRRAIILVILIAGCANQVPPTASPSLIPTDAPTATPSQAPTITPSATNTQVPPSPTEALPGAFVVDQALIGDHLDALQQIADDNNGIRGAGTPGYGASADYVAQVMTDLGYQVERQPFDFPFFNETEPVTLTVGDETWTSPEWVHAALYSASGDVEGALEAVGGGCNPGEWSGFTAGHVAWVEAGGCFTRQKVENAQSAGAVAMISFYPFWEKDQIRRPTLLDPAAITIPVVAAGRGPWETLARNADFEGATTRISVHGDSHTATVDNVIATLPGQTDDVVMLGSHLDSVLDGPGINDNGSGVATLMSLAVSVAAHPQPVPTIRFGFWSAEEFGDLGSMAYVNQLGFEDQQRITAYLNLDMVASPNPGRYVYDNAGAPIGSSEITQDLLDALASFDAPGLAVDLGANSDHFAFAQAGVPIGGVFSGLDPKSPGDAQMFGGTAGVPEDPCYHLACDTLDNIDLANAALLGQAVADVLYRLAY
ncbi:MAG: hypothetical protein QOJ81_341 [Chloroflexota bacterium]|jgi:hypothetical protein|nr:hypothetical protein [Chloroflexota bacterium]